MINVQRTSCWYQYRMSVRFIFPDSQPNSMEIDSCHGSGFEFQTVCPFQYMVPRVFYYLIHFKKNTPRLVYHGLVLLSLKAEVNRDDYAVPF